MTELEYQGKPNLQINPQVAAFWETYRQAIAEDGLDKEHTDWYVKHAQRFIDRNPDSKLKDKSPEDVRAYLARAAVYWSMKEMFYIQVVDALRVLFQRIVKSDWAAAFPWTQWQEPHLNFPDVLERYGERGQRPDRLPFPDRPRGGGEEKEKFRDSPGTLKAIDLFRAEFERLRTAIRARHYSIRTEQTYEDWLVRFLAFHQNAAPETLGAAHVREYLTHVLNRGPQCVVSPVDLL